MKLSKNTWLLAGAVLLGLGCFVGARYYLSSYLSQQETKLRGSYESRKVIVAAVEIPAGGTLSSDNLAVRTIPDRYLASTAMSPESLDVVAGQKIMVAVKPGDPIDKGALERTDRAALSTTIAKGERAITFPVDEISSISGMLVPGDIIDLLYTGPSRTANSYAANASAAGQSTEPKDLLNVRAILQAVPVMATGKITQKRVVRTQDGKDQEVNVDFSTVTLKVNSAQAQQVLIAQKLGQLTAILRNPDDTISTAKVVLDETMFKQVEGPPALGSVNYVEMIIGGSGAAGGLRVRSEAEAAGGAVASLISQIAPSRAAAPAPATASAQDVRNRLGLSESQSRARPNGSPSSMK